MPRLKGLNDTEALPKKARGFGEHIYPLKVIRLSERGRLALTSLYTDFLTSPRRRATALPKTCARERLFER